MFMLKLIFFLIVMARRRPEAAQQAILDDAEIPDGILPAGIQNFDGGVGLRAYLLDGFKRGRLTARDVCGMAYWSTKAGAHGVEDLVKDPALEHGGAFMEKVLGAVNARSKSSFYSYRVPLWDHHTQTRTTRLQFPFHLPHDIFADLRSSHPELFEKITEKTDLSDLPPTWAHHDVYLEMGNKAVPVSFYSDAVPHTKSDSFICYYFGVLGEKKRHLICSVRKNDCCKCGCRGECTTGCISRIIAWSYNVLSTGLYPSSDHLGDPFGDEVRFNMRGFELAGGYVGGLTEYRADLLEFIGNLGFKRWMDTVNPCLLCGCPKHALFDFPSSFSDYSWVDRDPEAYQIMCMRSIQKVRITTKTDLRTLMAHMEFSFDMWGYALDRDCSKFGLKKGQRLLAAGAVHDIHLLSQVDLPCDPTFFDTNSGMGVHSISPLLTDVRGFHIGHVALDVMHILDLGVSQHLCGLIMRTLVAKNFCKSSKRLAKTRQVDNMIHLRRCGWHHGYCLCALAGERLDYFPRPLWVSMFVRVADLLFCSLSWPIPISPKRHRFGNKFAFCAPLKKSFCDPPAFFQTAPRQHNPLLRAQGVCLHSTTRLGRRRKKNASDASLSRCLGLALLLCSNARLLSADIWPH